MSTKRKTFRPEKRKWQERAIKDVRASLRDHRRTLAVAPTGAGKTVVACLLIRRERYKHVLWVAHRYELIDQAYEALTGLGLRTGIIMAQEEELHGGERVDPEAPIQVASIQSLMHRGVPQVDLVVVDEAHHMMADSYQYLGRACSQTPVLGLTATPCRQDGRGLGHFFNDMIVMAKPSDLYTDGFLAQPVTYSAPPNTLKSLTTALDQVRTVAGEYHRKQLADAVTKTRLIGKIVDEAMRLAPGVPKVVFATSVRHSRLIASRFRKRGVAAEHLDAKTPMEERKRILADLRSGAVEVVSNVDVLSEGWDLPALGAVIIARPTKSLARYIQMAGRAQRTYKKRKPIVIDHGANVWRFYIAAGDDVEWSLEKGAEPGEEDRHKQCKDCNAVVEWGEEECPECGAELPVKKTKKQQRAEEEARLEAITRERLEAEKQALWERITEMAVKKNAPEGWAEKVFQEVWG